MKTKSICRVCSKKIIPKEELTCECGSFCSVNCMDDWHPNIKFKSGKSKEERE